MDELLHHCLRELAFDGDLGCNVSRLSDFINDFYTHSFTARGQKVDDAFCAFVWSLVVQQPTVRVGTIPDGITSEVWVAPQTSAKRKANAKGEEHVEVKPAELNLVPYAKSRPLAELQEEYGDKLRIASDPDAIYAAITGSHIRFPKMSPMVYSALQIITRGRDDGVTVVQLGQQSKYDQKTCFYLVKQLTELNLVAKVRRGGVGTHFVIHRYFFERSPSWKAIREEEISAELARKGAELPKLYVPDEEEKDKAAESLNFTPIDARHLSSLPLVRARVVKLLKASRNHMHVSSNMLLTIGFSNPTKTDRRFFQSRIRELVQQGILEKVIVPSNRKKSSTVLCLRLVDENGSSEDKDDDVVVLQPQDDREEEDFSQSGVRMNMTIHKQIIDLLEESGTNGMTLNDLSSTLCNFDKRTIELLLTRAEKFPPPAHLSDLGIAGLMETSGRERRHRYFTVSAYRTLVARENLDQSTAGYDNINLSDAGQFMSVEADAFYDNETSLHAYEDAFKEEVSGKGKKAKTVSTAPASALKRTKSKKRAREEDGEHSTSTRQGKKRKIAGPEVAEDVAGIEGSMSVGPGGRSNDATTETPSGSKRRARMTKSAATSTDTPESISSAPKRRGRPPKDATASGTEPSAPKKGGRPRKNPVVVSTPTQPSVQAAAVTVSTVDTRDVSPVATSETGNQDEERLPPRKRGRLSRSRLRSEMLDDEDSISLPESVLSNPNGGQQIDTQPVHVELWSSEQPAITTALPDASDIEGRDPEDQAMDVDVDMMAGSNPGSTMPISDQQSSSHVDEHIHTEVQVTAEEAAAGQATGIPTQQPTTEGSPTSAAAGIQHNQTKILQSTQHAQPDAARSAPAPQVAQPRGKVNVSNLRRENELLRVVEILGGIVNIQTKELYDAHMTLLETLAKAGEPTSSPVGIRTDKRTVAATFNSLENRGKIKQITTSIPAHLGMSRPTVVVYLPTVDQERLNLFLTELSRTAPPQVPSPYGRKISEPLDYGADPTRLTKNALPLQLLQLERPGTDNTERWTKNAARADQLFALDEGTIREVLLTERTTVSQYHGTIVAKSLRVRELHLALMAAFETGAPSTQIVSHGQRIFKIDFLCHDLPLGLYCKLVPALQHSDELAQFMSTEEGLNTIVKDLPDSLLNTLQIGRSRARARLLDSLDILRSLHLAAPLRPSSSPTPWLLCQPNGEHPIGFDKDPLDGWTAGTPSAAPSYWALTNKAPIYHWARSETTPPFLQDMSIDNLNHALHYWARLQEACTNKQLVTIDGGCQSSVGPSETGLSIAKALRRRVSWNPEYVMTWHQTQYLKKFYEVSNGNTPLDLEDAEEQISRISWVISAPQAVVRDYYASIRTRLKAELAEARKRRKKDSEKRAELEAKASLVKKAQEARLHRENEWEELIQRVHPEALSKAALARVKRIQSQFFQSTSKDAQKWENEILDAIREAEIVSKKPLKPNRRIAPTVPVKKIMPQGISSEAPPLASNPPEKSIASLIADQGPAAPPRPSTKKKRKRNEPVVENREEKRTPTRRHRFQWNRDYDELARDASAIIKARCRDAPRLDWGAFEQVFPAVPRNTVRQRVAHLREIPGNETYLNRLEDRWYELWQQHRGTGHLPDDDPTNATNFDLVKHIEFLRKHIDKNALRVGYAQPQHSVVVTIPDTVEKLLEQYDVIESSNSGPTYDFVWNALVEEGREKKLLSQPFTMRLDELTFEDASSEVVTLAESALKMALGTPNEVYEPEAASQMLHSIGEDAVATATRNLLNRGVLSKLVRDSNKSRPGRMLKISEVNQNALGGPINRDVFQDAALLEDLSAQEESLFREWPLLATDGDMASLIQLVSEDRVSFEVDTSHPQAMRLTLDWNSKKADDDQIETAIQVSFHDLSMASASPDQELASPVMDVAMSVDGPSAPSTTSAVHGKTVDGSPGCCRQLADRGMIDCSACLDEVWNTRSATFSPTELEVARLMLFLVAQAGENGVTKEDLLVNTKVPEEDLLRVMAKMTEEPFPLLNWIGYNSSFLISSAQSRFWTIAISEDPVMRVFPRRWLDIFGSKISDVWEAALKAVVGTLVFRPGISQVEVYWRLRSVYDRQEIIDLLRVLYEEGFIRNRRVSSRSFVSKIDSHALGALSEEEEKRVFWFVDESKHWYQI